jgi:hypothetical protein
MMNVQLVGLEYNEGTDIERMADCQLGQSRQNPGEEPEHKHNMRSVKEKG